MSTFWAVTCSPILAVSLPAQNIISFIVPEFRSFTTAGCLAHFEAAAAARFYFRREDSHVEDRVLSCGNGADVGSDWHRRHRKCPASRPQGPVARNGDRHGSGSHRSLQGAGL